MADDLLLYLFSSDQTERYAQDVLNILGLPRNAIYRFRYDARWMEARAYAGLIDNQMVGWPGLVCFSTQQPSKYTPAAFIPIRKVEIARSERVGDHVFVHFRLAELVALPRRKPDERWKVVRAFTANVRERCEAPYVRWASLGSAPDPNSGEEGDYDAGGDEDEYFERTAEYLVGTTAFSSARFIRFHTCSTMSGSDHQTELRGARPSLQLAAGETYQLELLQFVPEGGPGAGIFDVDADGTVVRILGEPKIRIGSRYDKPEIQLVAPPPAEYGTHWTTLVIDPDPSTRGPRLEIPVSVTSSPREALVKTGLTTLGLVILAIPVVFTHLPSGARVAFIVVGGLIASWIQVFGLSRPDFVELPEWATSRAPVSPTRRDTH